jgi:hypothetical protein
MRSSGFVFAGLPTRVVFGRGTVAQVADEVDRLDGGPVFLVHTPRMHTPIAVNDEAHAAFCQSGAGCLVARLPADGGDTDLRLSRDFILATN